MDCRVKFTAGPATSGRTRLSGNDAMKKRSRDACASEFCSTSSLRALAKQSSLQLTIWITSSLPLLAMTTTTTTTTKEKEVERRQTHCLMPARKRRAGRATEKAACAALRLRARSPAGVPPRFSPKGLSSLGLSIGPGFPKTARKLRRAARAVSVAAMHLARRS